MFESCHLVSFCLLLWIFNLCLTLETGGRIQGKSLVYLQNTWEIIIWVNVMHELSGTFGPMFVRNFVHKPLHQHTLLLSSQIKVYFQDLVVYAFWEQSRILAKVFIIAKCLKFCPSCSGSNLIHLLITVMSSPSRNLIQRVFLAVGFSLSRVSFSFTASVFFWWSGNRIWNVSKVRDIRHTSITAVQYV